jgi:hypothetical protein
MESNKYREFLKESTSSEKLDFLYEKANTNLLIYTAKNTAISKIIVIVCFLHFLISYDTIESLSLLGVNIKKHTMDLVRMALPLFLSSLYLLYVVIMSEFLRVSKFMEEIFYIKFEREIIQTDSSTSINEVHPIFALLIPKPLGRSFYDTSNKFLLIFYQLVLGIIYIIPFYAVFDGLSYIKNYNGYVDMLFMFYVMPIILMTTTFIMFARIIYVGVKDQFINTESDQVA